MVLFLPLHFPLHDLSSLNRNSAASFSFIISTSVFFFISGNRFIYRLHFLFPLHDLSAFTPEPSSWINFIISTSIIDLSSLSGISFIINLQIHFIKK